MKDPIIQLTGLTKNYGKITAVDKLDLHIYPGEIFGLLGPNGAGKTTSILMMLGLTEPTAGTAYVCGHNATRNPIAVKRKVGYLPDNVGFYPEMTAFENLCFIAELNGLTKSYAQASAKDMLHVVGLEREMHKKTGAFSRGMKQRLGLAEVLIKAPEVAILDEPTLGIDPKGVDEFLELIKQLSREHRLTVLLSSHHLHQVQRVCDRVGIFVGGKLLIEGSIESLAHNLQQQQGVSTVITLEQPAIDSTTIEHALNALPGIRKLVITGQSIELITDSNTTAAAVRILVNIGADIMSVSRNEYQLDDIYNTFFENSITTNTVYEKSNSLFKRYQ
ncbi:ABC transporter ATP-binding protein [Sphingobacterium detergens]|uniref:ABC-2 type transport system ATP-binding protein n=1 Tax=Sphingobacterium detergens TaxID=1145106 RepID=A0A420B7Y9_SPHD1|nr:ABC transporter ATP-binding protein [Sphingobacterium detergens]RKE52827.1 ABC-2 type transport system ATP-binding protein [Sphingobacterium detergens]